MTSGTISVNTDIGEGFGFWRVTDDAELLRYVSDANLACGFHGGDPDIMRQICGVAAERSLTVGAHVSFRDLIGFGRRHIDMDPKSLQNDILYQLGAVAAFLGTIGQRLAYVKLHGALYHSSATNEGYGKAVLAAVKEFDSDLPMMCQPNDYYDRAAALEMIPEGYIDRAYTPEGKLVPRSQPGAVITDHDAAVARAVRMATEGTIETIEGDTIPMAVRTICVHSDTPGAMETAKAVHHGLEAAGVVLASLPPRPLR